jgi:hypothetical protein
MRVRNTVSGALGIVFAYVLKAQTEDSKKLTVAISIHYYLVQVRPSVYGAPQTVYGTPTDCPWGFE